MERQMNGYYGIAVDLWELAAQEIGIPYRYIEFSSYETLINGLKSEEIDFIVTNLTVKHERAMYMKFSYPWYDGGLRVMVKTDNKVSLWEELKNNGQVRSYGLIVLLMFVLALIMTIYYRRHDPEFPRKWRAGFAMSLYHLVVAIKAGTYEGKIYGWLGHLFIIAWMVSGIALIAYITSTVTAGMTKLSIQNEITSINELHGKLIGVERGGVEEKYLRALGIRMNLYDNIMHAYEGLLADDVHAVIGDAPVLEYWAGICDDKNVRVIGALLNPDKYAFACNKRYADIMEEISLKLLELHDKGIIRDLKDNYLGGVG